MVVSGADHDEALANAETITAQIKTIISDAFIAAGVELGNQYNYHCEYSKIGPLFVQPL